MSSLALRGSLDDNARGPIVPDLQELVREHGGYEKITARAWAEFDRANREYQARRRELLARELARSSKNSRESASARRSVPAKHERGKGHE